MKKHIFYLLLLASNLSLHAQIRHVEPPFWWSDMKAQTLQIMIHGEKIAQYTAHIKDVVIKNVQKTENPNYLFITIETPSIPTGIFTIELKRRNKTVHRIPYEFKARRAGAALREGFDASDVVYLLMPDRFANGNPANDTHPSVTEKANRSLSGGRHGGDIQGVIDHLDYIKALGATAIWSTPLLEDNDPEYSYHTYAQSNVYRIDPRYGTNEDYRRLAEEMHKRDMKLLMDYVTNHWGAEHWMIKDLPTYDWIHQFPGYANSNYRMTTQYDPNYAEIDKKYCVDGWFTRTMPDLNQSNPLVLNYLTQNAIWWIEYANLDGFRVDTYSYNDKKPIAQWTKNIMEEYPHFNIVGEVWLHDQAQISYWQKDSKIGALQNYNSYLPSVMDFTLHDAINVVFNEEKTSWDQGIIKVYENFVNDFLYPDINNLMVFAENHDTQRINTLYPDIKKYKLAMTLLATVRGIPQLYYGSEIGMRGDKGKGDGDIRQDFPGGWPDDPNNAFSASGRTATQKAYFDFTATLFNWRKNKKVIHSGKTKHFLPQDNVYVYFRYNDAETVMVIINNNPETQNIDLKRFEEQTQTFSKGKDVISKRDMDIKGMLEISGKTSMILELR